MWPLLQVALPILHPIDVSLVRIGSANQDAGVAVAVSYRLQFATGQFAQPTLDFRMAIEESKAAGAVVISRGDITPAVQSSVTVQGGDVISVVDGIWMFVEQHEQAGRTALFGVRRFPPSQPRAQPRTVV